MAKHLDAPANANPRMGSVRQWRFASLLHSLSRLRLKFYDREMQPFGITRAQWAALVFLTRDGAAGLTQSELAQAMDIGAASAGGIVDRLERSGYVRRAGDPTDRRVNRVLVTTKGRHALDLLNDKAPALNAVLMQGIPDGDVEIVEDTLNQMKANLLLAIGERNDADAPSPERGA